MSDLYRIDPAYKINSWLLHELYQAQVLEESDYEVENIQFKPIFPVQQPAPTSLTKDGSPDPLKLDFHGEPFMVYEVSIPSYGTQSYYICEEQIMYRIFARDFMDAREVQVATYDIFHRLDESARDLNAYLAQDSPFRFHWLNVVDSPPPDPKDSPDDPANTFIMIEYQYARKIKQNGRFAS